jgi:hypothetical protein
MQDNTKTDIKETGWERLDWMYIDQDSDHWLSLVNTLMNFLIL